MTSMTRHQLRAARALLALQQEALAHEADVGVASLRRFENGNDIGDAVVEAIRDKLVEHGVILIAPGTIVNGREVGQGVAIERRDALPADTRDRLDRIDLSSERAAEEIPDIKTEGVGRRVRSRVPDIALEKREPGMRRGSKRKGRVPPTG